MPGKYGRKNDEVCAMYIVVIVCVISKSTVTNTVVRRILCCMMATMLFVWCARMSFIMIIHVMTLLTDNIQVWVMHR